jgi:NADH dehydrogenase
VGDLRFWKSAGFAAWLLWASVHIYFLIGFANRLFVMLRWMVQFVTRRHGVGTIAAQTPAAGQRLDKAG